MKKIIKYIIIFILMVLILFFALVASSMIPRSAIEENLKESAEFYKQKAGIHRMKNKSIYSYIHYFADTRKLNIIYCLDSSKPIESTLWARYYQVIKMDTNKDFIDVVENKREPNTQYLRYWNGCMLFLRPLLTIFNMEQIYLINKILLAILLAVIFVVLFRKSKKIAFIFLASLILTASWYVPYCIEYSVTFYIMFITTIIAIKINNNKDNNIANERLLKLFLIVGVLTSFFDFLTTELLTIFIPLTIILLIRKEENRLADIKSVCIFLIKSVGLWLIGYAGMWLSKWILASVILHINAFDYVKDNFVLRINGLQGLKNHKELYNHVIGRNFFAVPIINLIYIYFYRLDLKIAIAGLVFLILFFVNWKDFKDKKIMYVLLFIASVPYIRYLILANHSYRHVMFTFRDQIITIIILLYIIIDCLNYKRIQKEVSIKSLLSKKIKKGEKI